MTPSERAEIALFGQTRGFHTGSEERDLYAISKATLVRTIEAAEKDVLSGVAQGAPSALGAAQFLLDRLDEFDPGEADAEREYHGHVAPAIARLRTALTSTECGEGK